MTGADKAVLSLQAAAALRGITVSAMRDGSYMVGHGVYLRDVADFEALAALLAKMGVALYAAPVAAYSVSKPG